MSETEVQEQETEQQPASATPEPDARDSGLRPIDRIRKATRARRRKIEVEDWGVTLYFGTLTTADVEAVDAAMEDDGKQPEKNSQERRLRLLIEKAELEDGSRAFRPGDLHHLRSEADYMTLQRVIGFMYNSMLSVDAAKKDSAGTPTSETS